MNHETVLAAILEGHLPVSALPVADQEPRSLAERIRRQAQRLVRRHPTQSPRIIQRRDQLVLLAYHRSAPPGTHSGWFDASLPAGADRPTGVGMVLAGPEGDIIARKTGRTPERDAVRAEITALERLMELAAAAGAEKLRAHTDCKALHHLWLTRRQDDRLGGIRQRRRAFRSLSLIRVPRLHNPVAHHLAAQAARTASPG